MLGPQCSTIQPIMAIRRLFIQDGQRDAREKDEHPLPQCALVEICHYQAESHQREQVAEAIAGLGHLQL